MDDRMVHSNLNGIEKLDGVSNYHSWKFAIQNLLILENLWESVLGTDSSAEKDARAKRALARICLAIKPALYQYVRNIATPKDAWKKLSDVFEDKGLYRRVLLLRKLLRIQFVDFDSMESYLETISILTQQLHDIGKVIEDAEVAEIMLSGLPADYDALVSNLSTATVTNTISSELVRSRLLQEFSRKHSGVGNETAYVVNKMNKKQSNSLTLDYQYV